MSGCAEGGCVVGGMKHDAERHKTDGKILLIKFPN